MVDIRLAWKGSGRKAELLVAIMLCFIALIAPTEYEGYDANGNYINYPQPLYLFWLFMAFCAVFFYIVGTHIIRFNVPRR